MANQYKGELTFAADGKDYTLHYSHAALIELEDELDKGIVAITSEIVSWTKEPERMRLGIVRAILWAGLRKHHPEVDLDAAGELITAAGGVGKVVEMVGESLQRTFAGPETKEARPQRARRNGTGKDSPKPTLVSDTISSRSGD